MRWFVFQIVHQKEISNGVFEGISGSYKFIQKIWTVSEMIQNIDKNNNLSKDDISKNEKAINKLIKEVTFNIENFHFNVAVAKFYEFMNFLSKNLHENRSETHLFKKMFKDFLILIYPFTPHIASECWEKILIIKIYILQVGQNLMKKLLKRKGLILLFK